MLSKIPLIIIVVMFFVAVAITRHFYPEVWANDADITYGRLEAVVEFLKLITLEFSIAVAALIFFVIKKSSKKRAFIKKEMCDIFALALIVFIPIAFIFLSIDLFHGIISWLMRDTDVVSHTIQLAKMSESIDGADELVKETNKALFYLLTDENRFNYHRWVLATIIYSIFMSFLGLNFVIEYCKRRNKPSIGFIPLPHNTKNESDICDTTNS